MAIKKSVAPSGRQMYVIHPSTLNRLGCRLQYKWSRDYQPLHAAPALDFGIAIHHALEQYYWDEVNPVKAFTEYWDASHLQIMLTGKMLADPDRDLGMAMMANYLKQYGGKEKFRVMYTEKEIARRIPIPEDDPNPPERAKRFYVAARVDGIVMDPSQGNRIFVLEHKTFSTFYPNQLSMDHQFVIEAFVAGGITKNPIAGVIYNGLRKTAVASKTTKLFERHTIYITEQQIKTMLYRAYWSLKMTTDPEFKVYPEPSTLRCQMCEFKQPCTEYMRGGDPQFYLDTVYKAREDEEDQWL